MGIGSPIFNASQNAQLALAIGDVILAWTDAEYEQVSMMAAMLNVSHAKASRLYHQIPNFRSRTQALYALVASSDGFEEIKPFIAKFSKLSKTRNEIVHGVYIAEFGSTKIWRAKLDEETDHPRRSVETKPNDIRQHAERVREVCREFTAAGRSIPAYKAWLGPHPKGIEVPHPQEAPK